MARSAATLCGVLASRHAVQVLCVFTMQSAIADPALNNRRAARSDILSDRWLSVFAADYPFAGVGAPRFF